MTKHMDVSKMEGLTRRQFMVVWAAAGASLVMGFSVLPTLPGSAKEALAAGNCDPSLFISMEPSGTTTVHITKAEMGQHVGTGRAQSVAEELEVDRNDIRIES